ncbi:uncharacterized protein Rv0525 [Clavibacter sp.]|nr:uncharacterized protein Rv0525 [Clavibacter sp.]
MLKAMSDEAAISQSVHLLRHGQVENPKNILYGRQPGWKLSERGHEMAKTVATWSKELSLGAIHASPLERAQQTAAPIAAQHGLTIKTDENLIEAENIFEGKPFDVSGAIKRPATWRHLWNPWRPSWGEPYKVQVSRMSKAVNDARLAADGKMLYLFHINCRFGLCVYQLKEDLFSMIQENANAHLPQLLAFTLIRAEKC